MKLFKQFTIITLLSFIGEVLHALVPFPIPASIYGILLLFFALERKILQVDDVKEVSDFLIFIMPLLFIPAAVGLIDAWNELRASLTAYVTIIIAVTLIVMVATGLITQWFLRHSRRQMKTNKGSAFLPEDHYEMQDHYEKQIAKLHGKDDQPFCRNT